MKTGRKKLNAKLDELVRIAKANAWDEGVTAWRQHFAAHAGHTTTQRIIPPLPNPYRPEADE
jgi:hypothetical protein